METQKLYYIHGRTKCAKNNTKIIEVNYHEYVKIHKRLSRILDNYNLKIPNRFSDDFPQNKEIILNYINRMIQFTISNNKRSGRKGIFDNVIVNIQEYKIEDHINDYTNFALSFKMVNERFVLDTFYLYNSFSYYDPLGIHYLTDPDSFL